MRNRRTWLVLLVLLFAKSKPSYLQRSRLLHPTAGKKWVQNNLFTFLDLTENSCKNRKRGQKIRSDIRSVGNDINSNKWEPFRQTSLIAMSNCSALIFLDLNILLPFSCRNVLTFLRASSHRENVYSHDDIYFSVYTTTIILLIHWSNSDKIQYELSSV